MSPKTARRKVLVVEDDSDAAELIAQALRADYEVVIASDGIEGVERAAQEPPDLVITDVDMPRLGGLAMAHHLRARQGLRAPIIFMSGLGGPRDIIAGITAGARHYLVKPVAIADLRRRVDVILAKK